MNPPRLTMVTRTRPASASPFGRELRAERQATRLNARVAFTLVELLVVITIIGILASLISVAAVNAVYTARQMRIKVEVDQLDAAMKEFKQRYGAYPPCDLRVGNDTTSNLPLRSFLARAFPRYTKINTNELDNDLTAAGIDPTVFDPARALVFWLSGFNPDVTRPFCNSDGTPFTGTRVPLYGFDKTRLLNATTGAVADGTIQPGNMVYVPSGGQNVPYLFFDYRAYTLNAANPQPANPNNLFTTLPTWLSAITPGTPTPYALDQNGDGILTPGTVDAWCNADSIQIISAGQDGKYGATPAAPKLFPRGTGYSADDNDNVTNFSDKASLEDSRP